MWDLFFYSSRIKGVLFSYFLCVMYNQKPSIEIPQHTPSLPCRNPDFNSTADQTHLVVIFTLFTPRYARQLLPLFPCRSGFVQNHVNCLITPRFSAWSISWKPWAEIFPLASVGLVGRVLGIGRHAGRLAFSAPQVDKRFTFWCLAGIVWSYRNHFCI